jgi:hypothetical protein
MQPCSRRESGDDPLVLLSRVAKTIVQPTGSSLPELEGLRDDAVSTPMWWSWNLCSFESSGDFVDQCGERFPTVDFL